MKRLSLRRTIRRLQSDSGQGMTEYIIIVALIAIAAIGVVTVFGTNIRQIFGASTQALSGNRNATNQSKAARVRDKSLKDFSKSTQQGD
jgi:Flp pilus assembly pilin Flp